MLMQKSSISPKNMHINARLITCHCLVLLASSHAAIASSHAAIGSSHAAIGSSQEFGNERSREMAI